MENFNFKFNNPEENHTDKRVKEYISCYLKELQRHFDITDKKMRTLIYQIYQELKPLNFFKKNIYVLKSLYHKLSKRK